MGIDFDTTKIDTYIEHNFYKYYEKEDRMDVIKTRYDITPCK
jgi:hypothetical protein